jgi:hypothetical protein
MVIKDFFCEGCQAENYGIQVESVEIVHRDMWCSRCNAETHWAVICNGGTGKRYRTNDISEDYLKGLRSDVRWMGPHATLDGKPCVDEHGNALEDNREKYNEDIRAERREQWESERRAQFVGPRLFNDLGSR